MNGAPSDLLGYGACLVLCSGLAGLVVTAWFDERLRGHLARHEAALEHRLQYLQYSVGARRFLIFQAGAALAALTLGAFVGTPAALALSGAVLALPGWRLTRSAATRTQRIEMQLDGWLVTLANALHGSGALGDAVAQSQKLVAAPLKDELARSLREHELGVPLDRALQDLGQRIESPVVSAGLATLRIARNTGGDLAATLKAAAASLRELARLEGVVRTKTAEGRAQALVIALVPPPLVGLLLSLDPELLAPLWSTPRGHIVVAAAVVLWGAALFLARKILAVDI